MVKQIQSAKNKVYLEVYMFTETRIFEALKKDQKRGVEVKVILEQYPYKSGNINNKLFSKLKKAGINVVWSDSHDYKLNHAKFLIIDNLAYISTGNMTYSTFKHNRDFFIATSDAKIVKNLEQIFHDDFAGHEVTRYNQNLVVSPIYSRSKLETMLLSAQKNIKIYMQYFLDENINSILKQIKNEKNIDIQILVDKKNMDSDTVKNLQKHGVQIQTIPTKIHAKAVLIDEKYIFIGSENFSKSSLDQNREMGIILKNKNIIEQFLEVFSKDWKH